ncbi:MAG: pyrroline-5-carboxylate reductase [Thermodesulfobacteriota bacterium]|nr:pyrroline-5-carboxylate reductase [Thermodesulfobacteriota bacterium]
MIQDKKIGFIGSGNMAEAIMRGIIEKGVVSAVNIIASDILDDRRKLLSDSFNITTTSDNAELVSQVNIIFLAVKPQIVETVLNDTKSSMDVSQLIVSIAAGITLTQIEGSLPPKSKVIRVMPNTPALIGEGVAAISPGSHATKEDVALVRDIFDAVGKTVITEEKYMDAVTGLSGSGPAYVFLMIEALMDGGVKAGLNRETARTLAVQTFLGSAKMLFETGEHPAKLKDMVTSPGGTTIEGLHALEDGNIRAVIMNAVEVATERSRELGKKF